MRTIKKKTLSVLLVFCMLFSMVNSAFAANYEGDAVVQGLEGIQPEDTLTLPDNTIWATLTASWGVQVIFQDYDETVLQSENIAVSDTTPGSTTAPADPTRDGYVFTGWERTDSNGDTSVTLDDEGNVTNITGPGPIIYKATYEVDEGITTEEGKILIPFTKTWVGTPTSSLTVTLYRYLGDTFDVSTATEVETKTISASDNWKCVFDISNGPLFKDDDDPSADTAYKWAVVETPIAGYEETAHDDPDVVFFFPNVEESAWVRNNDCSKLIYDITTGATDNSVVVGWKGNDAVIWSYEKLSPIERKLITNSITINCYNTKNTTFVSGIGASSDFGMTVTQTQIQFLHKSDWAHFAVGLYQKSSLESNSGSIENTYEPTPTTLAIPVSKTVSGTPPTDEEFSFTLTAVTDGAPMPTSATATITGTGEGAFGDITYTLPGEWEYSVSETPGSTPGYKYDTTTYNVKVTVSDTNGALGATYEVATSAGASADEVAFTNTYSTGKLTVTKTVDGNAADKTKTFSFTVTLGDTSISGTYGDMTFVNGVATFTLTDGGSKTAEGLPNGVIYTVVETDYTNDGYVTTKRGDEGSIVGDDTLTAAFTNTRNAEGSLTVSKTLSGNDTDSTKDFTFTIKLNDTSINGTYSGVIFTDGEATVTLKGGESKTIEGLPNGTGYTVTEADYSADGYENSNPNGYTGTIDENTPAVAAFTNTRNTYGSLIVTKTVDGNAGSSTKEFSFTVTLKDTSISGAYGDMTFVNGVATFTLKDGESKTATGLPNGVGYAVVEADYSADGYVTTKRGDEGTIVGDDTLTAAFTNTRNAEGSLTVSKTLSGNDTDSTKDFTFTIKLDTALSGTYSGVVFTNGEATITLKGGESKTIEGLPNGTGYTVTEADYSADGYENSNPNGYTGTIDENTPAVAAFTNTRNTYGNLTVTKTVDGNAGSSSKEFSFTVTLKDTSISGTYGDMTFVNGVATFTLKDGESKTATGLPNGVGYTVAEADYSADGYVTTKSGDKGTIADGKTATAAFTNTKNIITPPTPPADPEIGNLTISKNVTGDLGDKTKYFTFKVEFNVDGTFSYIGSKTGTITNGGTIQLKHGESITIVDIPAGTSYTVTESGNSGYSVYASGDTGIISDGKTSTAKFTNTRSSVPKTGDHSNMPLWFSLMGISVLGMIGTLFIKTNKRRKAAHLRNK